MGAGLTAAGVAAADPLAAAAASAGAAATWVALNAGGRNGGGVNGGSVNPKGRDPFWSGSGSGRGSREEPSQLKPLSGKVLQDEGLSDGPSPPK